MSQPQTTLNPTTMHALTCDCVSDLMTQSSLLRQRRCMNTHCLRLVVKSLMKSGDHLLSLPRKAMTSNRQTLLASTMLQRFYIFSDNLVYRPTSINAPHKVDVVFRFTKCAIVSPNCWHPGRTTGENWTRPKSASLRPTLSRSYAFDRNCAKTDFLTSQSNEF